MAHKQAQEISGTPMTPRCYRNSSFNPKEGCEGFSIRTPAKASAQNSIKPQRFKKLTSIRRTTSLNRIIFYGH